MWWWSRRLRSGTNYRGAAVNRGFQSSPTAEGLKHRGVTAAAPNPVPLDLPAPPALNYGKQLPYNKRQEYELETGMLNLARG